MTAHRPSLTLLAAGAASLTALVVGFAFTRRFLRRAAAERRAHEAAERQAEPEASPSQQDGSGQECRLSSPTNTCLLVLSSVEGVEELIGHFSGTLLTDLTRLPNFAQKTVYLCGDLTCSGGLGLDAAEHVLVVKEFTHGHFDGVAWQAVGIGQVPILVHGVGVYYRRFFDSSSDLFNRIRVGHEFQALTESNKGLKDGKKAHRTGLYLTPVEQDREHNLHFRLLRCSTNLDGPTANFSASDTEIVRALNEESRRIFDAPAPLNHVLAQIYHNTPATDTQKQTKAKIKAHADKTKDMPKNGVMAFCTFYDDLHRLEPLPNDRFDLGKFGTSGLTKLQFHLKRTVAERPGCTLTPQFSVTLFPNSVFFMPLSTNRLYTHEIRPASLDAALLPTRMGYVVRCSSTEAVHKGGQTLLKRRGKHGEELVPLEPPTPDGMFELRKLYADENISDAFVDYGRFLFSMNDGDYARPLLSSLEERQCDDEREPFQRLELPADGNLFEELLSSAPFEDVGKGRQGAVLVDPHATRGTPIVRTTSKYTRGAQCFRPVHTCLARRIEESAALPVGVVFNNALIEKYTNAYASMGFHSDQALDLLDGSHIALYSCYKDPDLATPCRKLVIEAKQPGGGAFEIPLLHNSVVVFSLDTNRRYRHKIVLDTTADAPENTWLGVTFRTSNTFVDFRDGRPFFEDGTPLTLADGEECKRFYGLRRQENERSDFAYSRLLCTISNSDMIPPDRGEDVGAGPSMGVGSGHQEIAPVKRGETKKQRRQREEREQRQTSDAVGRE